MSCLPVLEPLEACSRDHSSDMLSSRLSQCSNRLLFPNGQDSKQHRTPEYQRVHQAIGLPCMSKTGRVIFPWIQNRSFFLVHCEWKTFSFYIKKNQIKKLLFVVNV